MISSLFYLSLTENYKRIWRGDVEFSAKLMLGSENLNKGVGSPNTKTPDPFYAIERQVAEQHFPD